MPILSVKKSITKTIGQKKLKGSTYLIKFRQEMQAKNAWNESVVSNSPARRRRHCQLYTKCTKEENFLKDTSNRPRDKDLVRVQDGILPAKLV